MDAVKQKKIPADGGDAGLLLTCSANKTFQFKSKNMGVPEGVKGASGKPP